MNLKLSLMAGVLFGLLGLTAQAADTHTHDRFVVHHGWIRTAPPNAPVHAGYARVENHGDTAVTIDAVQSEAFSRIEIHEMHNENGMMRMRAMPALTLEAGQGVDLAPGGWHLMLFDAKQPLPAGTEVTIRFLQGESEVAQGVFQVRDDAGNDQHQHHHSHGH